MRKQISELTDHYVICGFGRIGQNLSSRLTRHRVPFVVIDPCTEAISEAQALGYLCMEADALDENVLDQAGLSRATTIVISSWRSSPHRKEAVASWCQPGRYASHHWCRANGRYYCAS